MTDQHETPDPTRHLLSRERFERQPDGSQLRRPISLAEAERDWRDLAAADQRRRIELGLEYPEEGEQIVAITDALAMGLAAMLEELALRLAPGRAVGPIQAGDGVAGVTDEYARDLRALV
jgi:rRNA maturation endonuclease Nob1